MSSLFRKPKKRFQRRAIAGDDEDENDNAMEVDELPPAPPPPTIIAEKPSKDKSVGEKGQKPKSSLLSFGDEDDESEMFRVKKSSHSKKLQRQMDRERRSRTTTAPVPPTGNGRAAAVIAPAVPPALKQDVKTDNSRNNDHSIKERSYEGLILSGRAALVAGTLEDVSGSGSDASEEEESKSGRRAPFSHSFRPSRDAVRAMLDRGVIPDAATIHAARKTRQKAREVTGADYIALRKQCPEDTPVSAMSDDVVSTGGRLVREDGDGDGSDEDADRIEVRGVIEDKRATKVIDQQSRKGHRKQVNQQIGHGSDPDSAGEEWEAQQIRKAVTGAQIMAAQTACAYYPGGVTAYAMPPSYSDSMMAAMHGGMAAAPPLPPPVNVADHLTPLLPHGESPDLPKTVAALKDRIINMKNDRMLSLDRVNLLRDQVTRASDSAYKSSENVRKHSARYKLYQKLRGYFTDLLECLDEKMPLLESLEQRSVALRQKQSSFLAERRRADVRDQAQDALLLTAKPGTVKPPDNEEKIRRAAEREGRRQRRRRNREAAISATGIIMTPHKIVHRDGDSSDDEIPQSTERQYTQTEDVIREDAARLFSDALPSYSRLRCVLSRAALWRAKDRNAYGDAFVADCLPKLVAPYVRMELLLWNPIAGKDDTVFENMLWYRLLMQYSAGLSPSWNSRNDVSSDSDMSVDGVEEDEVKAVVARDSAETLAEDPDSMIVPKVIAGVVIPKLAELIESSWEPLSNRGTARLLSLLQELGPKSKFPGLQAKATPIATALTDHLALAVAHDVFVPVLPRNVIETRGGAFFIRQVNSCCRLLKNSLRMHGILSDDSLDRLIITQLLDRYLLSAIRCCPPTMGVDICQHLITCLPPAWLPATERLQKLVECVKTVRDQLQRDNPLHMKPLDILKTVLNQLMSDNQGVK